MLLAIGLTIGAALLGIEVLVEAADPPSSRFQISALVLDEGRLLHAARAADRRSRLPVMLEAVDPKVLKMLLAFETRRLQEHSGVDPVALAPIASRRHTPPSKRLPAGPKILQSTRAVSDGLTMSDSG